MGNTYTNDPDNDNNRMIGGGPNNPNIIITANPDSAPEDDIFNATVQTGPNRAQFHVYGDGQLVPGVNRLDGGDDVINLMFEPVVEYSNGHHVFGQGGNDTFNFMDTADISHVVVGRIDDFDATRDVIQIEGQTIDLYDPPSNVSFVTWNGEHNDAVDDEQLWIRIDTTGGGVIFYALEGARVDMGGAPGISNGGAQERHFVDLTNFTSDDGSLSAITTFLDSLPTTDFFDPHNIIPDIDIPNSVNVITDLDLAQGTNIDDLPGYVNAMINGTNGVDYISAGLNDDAVDAGAGDDKIWGGSGSDTIDGGGGDDMIAGNRGNDVLTGSSGADTFVFEGNFGNDVVTDFNRNQAGEVIDLAGVYGITDWQDLKGNHLSEDGNDVIINDGNGNAIRLEDVHFNPLNAGDFVFVHEHTGGNGADALTGTYARDALYGGAGSDVLGGEAGTDILNGGTGSDVLTGGAHSDIFVFEGNFGSDTITDFDAGTDGDLIDLTGVSGIDSFADLQANHLTDTGLDVVITDDNGNTITIENTFSAHITADDFIFASAPAPNTIIGTNAGNTLNGTSESDMISGLAGNDKLYGGAGDDHLVGGAGNDKLYGGAGDDYLIAGEGTDRLYGGAGSDTFHFETYDDGRSYIHGFEVGVDKISIDMSSSGIANYAELAGVMEDGGQGGNHSFVRDGNNDFLFFLVHVNTPELSESDFIFV